MNGAQKADELRAAGFSDAEISNWVAQQRNELTDAGFRQDEIDSYFGRPPLDTGPVKRAFKESIDASIKPDSPDGQPKQITSFAEAWDFGLQMSVSGLMKERPENKILVEDAPMTSRLAFGLGQLAGDLPFAIGGAIAGMSGGPIGALAGASALPPGMRAVLMDSYARGSSTTFGDFFEIAGPAMWETAKGYLVGAATGAAGKAVAPVTAAFGPTTQAGAILSTEVTTMVATQAALEGHIPRAQDFLDAAVLLGGLKLSVGVAAKLRSIYSERGITPDAVLRDAEVDPSIKGDLLSENVDVPTTYKVKGPDGKITEFEQIGPKGEPLTEGSLAEAQQKVLDKVRIGGTDAKPPTTLDTIKTAMLDQLDPIRRLQKEAGVEFGPYEQTRLLSGSPGKADAMLKFGVFSPENPTKVTGPSFNSALEPIKEKINDFRAYVVSERALEIEAQGKRSGIDVEAAQKVVDGTSKEIKNAGVELVRFQNGVLDYAQKQGLLTPEAASAMKEGNKHYVPFFRVMDDSTASGKSLKELKGSMRGIVDPLESVMKNTFALVAAADRNAAKLAVIDLARKTGVEKAEKIAADRGFTEIDVTDVLREQGMKDVPDDLLRSIKTVLAPTKGTTITALRDGKVEAWRVSPELADAVNYTNRDSSNIIFNLLAAPARLARAGAVFSPDFIAKSPMRDFFAAAINSKERVTNPFAILEAIGHMSKQSEVYQNWMRSGGANSSIVALDRRYLQDNLLKLNEETGYTTRLWNMATLPAQRTMIALRTASEFSDAMMRIPEFQRRMAAGEGPAKAAMAAREITVDFAKIGAKMHAVNTLVPFLNAGIQGLERTFREAKERPASFLAKGTAYITLPTMALFAVNSDDPWYWAQPQWIRDQNWLIPVGDVFFKIPKPFELGVMFGTTVERMMADFMLDKPDAWKGFHKTIIDAFNPLSLPSFMAPQMEQRANENFFGAPLVPKYVEGQLPEYQYTQYTTETAKALGRLVSAFPGMENVSINDQTIVGGTARAMSSPILIENYVKGWTGGLGVYALQISDYGLRKAGVVPDPVQPASRLIDIPFVKSFVVPRYPAASSSHVEQFYENYNNNKVRFDTYMAKAREGDIEATERIRASGGEDIFVRFDAYKEAIGMHSKLIRDFYRNPDMTREDKRQLIDAFYFNMISMAQQANEAMRAMKSALKE